MRLETIDMQGVGVRRETLDVSQVSCLTPQPVTFAARPRNPLERNRKKCP